jgi:dihydrolipoamide dehydrogenase
MSLSFDVIVIGAGPGGYVCAIRAAQLGLKVACVEKRATLGGTCLNVGCIPSKALLQSSEHFEEANHKLAEHGVNVGQVSLDLGRMQARKGEVVGANVKGVEFLFKKNKVTWLKGEGKITAPGTVQVTGRTTPPRTSSSPPAATSSPCPAWRSTRSASSPPPARWSWTRCPKHLVVIGGGYIGLELGSVWHRLGAEVTVVEYLDRLVPAMDTEVGKAFERILGKQGLRFRLKTKVTGATVDDTGVDLTVEPAAGGAAETLRADVVLVAIGRRPYVESLGLEAVGVALDERGRVKTDEHFATSVPGIWAIGDVIAGPMLAHKAEEEGVALAEQLAGQKPHVNYNVIPGVVYTWPEVASVGETEEQLRARGQGYKVGKFPFTANGRARAMGDMDGFVKILADDKSDRVLGAHILGPTPAR